ncbi:Ribonuclease P, Rpp40 [Ascosphaera apis ARSEF 7405]|uniref:Ribonuclease P, Rpp40 n=1 Tax=Ascosphaera apis ARSEF 7405 TaxID=392613 RepID=A0A167Z8R5_9EURO|nr:Ribonuclease P, Rpp40 [Ascosphaera apis ARSEF 7405]
MIDLEPSEDFQRDFCRTSYGSLPQFVNPDQPTKKKHLPFSSINRHQFIHDLQLVIPQDDYDAAWDSRLKDISVFQYAKLNAPLSALLDGDFLNQYIKAGNILMISEGRPGVDTIYTLSDGILRIELDKSIYEKVGIVGKAVKHGGRTHVKERYLIELNLRLPSMLHGKKGFEKLVWASKQVLTDPVTWLFCDLNPTPDYTEKAPISQLNPKIITVSPELSTRRHTLVPPLDPTSSTYNPPSPSASQATDKHAIQSLSQDFLKQTTDDLSEWLALVALDSDRVRSDDTIDPYLSRYELPTIKEECKEQHLLSLRWKGLIPAEWILRLFVSLLRHVQSPNTSPNSWFALTSSAFPRKAMDNDKGYTILSPPQNDHSQNAEIRRKYVLWEYAGGMGFF